MGVTLYHEWKISYILTSSYDGVRWEACYHHTLFVEQASHTSPKTYHKETLIIHMQENQHIQAGTQEIGREMISEIKCISWQRAWQHGWYSYVLTYQTQDAE